MDIVELKRKILNKHPISFPLVFISDNDEYLVKTYLKQISVNQKKELREIKNLKEMQDIETDMFYADNYIFIYHLDSKTSISYDLISRSCLIIITDSSIPDLPGDIQVNFPKQLLPWQIEDYIQTLVPGLSKPEVSWLCKITKYNLYRLDNEAQKLNIFTKKEQQSMFEQINSDNGYIDLNDLSIFDLTNAIIKKDVLTIKKIIKDLDNIDIEGTGLVTILLKQFLNIISIQLSRYPTPQLCNMSEKQFKAVKYNCYKYSDKSLVDIYEFLSSIDSKLKAGLLDMTNQELVYYILAHVITK